MFSVVAGLICLSAILIPLYLLYRFRSLAWPIHILAIAAAIGLGMAPGTALLNSPYGTFVYLFAFLFLMTWGIGGLVGFRPRRNQMTAGA